jgi:hypothetical protein
MACGLRKLSLPTWTLQPAAVPFLAFSKPLFFLSFSFSPFPLFFGFGVSLIIINYCIHYI